MQEKLVLIESVYPLTEKQTKELEKHLKETLDFPFKMETKQNVSLLGGMRISIDSVVIDASLSGVLEQFQENIQKQNWADLNYNLIANHFAKCIDSFNPEITIKEQGKIEKIADGILHIKGLPLASLGEKLLLKNNTKSFVFNLNTDSVDAVLLNHTTEVSLNDTVERSYEQLSIPVGFELLGRIINPIGEPQDSGESLATLKKLPIFRPAPPIIDRQAVKEPLQTGIKGIDALVPIGLGQRELIIGDRQTGKTTLILDTIIHQHQINQTKTNKKDKVYSIYVAIGQKQSSVYAFVETLKKYDALKETIIVTASAADSAGLQYIAPYAGCSIGEFFRDSGYKAVLFLDDLSKHAVAYRTLSLLLKRPSGREAYPGDIFFIHSKLLERAAKIKDDLGGGSLTAIPVIETLEGDVSAYIPTNVISITDGQIFLETSLFNKGIRPAINVGLSVSRVGSSAQTPIIKKIAGSLKLTLAQYRELQAFSQFSSDLDADAQKMLKTGARLTEMLKQKPFSPFSLAEEAIILFAGVNGFFNEIEVKDITKFESYLLNQMQISSPKIFQEIDDKPVLSPELTKRLKDIIEPIKNRFLQNA